MSASISAARLHASGQAELVTVHAEEHHAAAVEREQAVLDREPAHADPLHDHLGQVSGGVAHLDLDVVERRDPPGSTVGDGRDGCRSRRRRDPRALPRRRCARAPSPAAQRDAQCHIGDVVVGREIDVDADVLDVHRRSAEEHHVAEQPREAEEVLVLEPRSAGELEDLRGELVLPVDERVGQVELRRREAVGRVPEVAAVQPDGDGALGSVEAHAAPSRPPRAAGRARSSSRTRRRGCSARAPGPARSAPRRPTGTAR